MTFERQVTAPRYQRQYRHYLPRPTSMSLRTLSNAVRLPKFMAATKPEVQITFKWCRWRTIQTSAPIVSAMTDLDMTLSTLPDVDRLPKIKMSVKAVIHYRQVPATCLQQLVACFGNLSLVSATSCRNKQLVAGDKLLELVSTCLNIHIQ